MVESVLKLNSSSNSGGSSAAPCASARQALLLLSHFSAFRMVPVVNCSDDVERQELRERAEMLLLHQGLGLGRRAADTNRPVDRIESELRRLDIEMHSIAERRSSVRISQAGRFISPFMSIFTHSCMPNVACRIEAPKLPGSPPLLVFEALSHIRKGSPLTLALVSVSLPLHTRRREMAKRGINCTCARCEAQRFQSTKGGGKGIGSRLQQLARAVERWNKQFVCVCGRVRLKFVPKDGKAAGGKMGVDLLAALNITGRALKHEYYSKGKPAALKLIHTAYLRSIFKWHPDRNRQEDMKKLAHRMSKLVDRAKEVMETAVEQGELSDAIRECERRKESNSKNSNQAARAADLKGLEDEEDNSQNSTRTRPRHDRKCGRCKCADRPVTRGRINAVVQRNANMYD
mmetsp:Transcript_6146/g.11352  ORF Transcript_6146/g.11352 Transcript_6146/m.11352 type:complete len:403 (+) Transcript_6146:570-1778(+)